MEGKINVLESDKKLTRIIWDYNQLNEPVERNADAIFLMGSIDLLPAKIAAGLALADFSKILVISGGANGRNYDRLKGEFQSSGLTEAEMLAKSIDKYGVGYILEKESQNSGQNVLFSHNILANRGIFAKYVIGVHMPSSERRDKATISKQWPGIERVVMASPKLSMEEYQELGYQGSLDWQHFIEDMLGDFQRTFIFPRPEFGFMTPQSDMPETDVLITYELLVGRGYTSSLVRNKSTGNPYSIEDFVIAS